MKKIELMELAGMLRSEIVDSNSKDIKTRNRAEFFANQIRKIYRKIK